MLATVELAVADDQLALAAADRNHRVDGLEARLQRLAHRLTEDDARSLALQGHVDLLPADVAEAVQRIAERVHDTAHERLAHGNGGDAVGSPDDGTFLQKVGRAHQDGAHVVVITTAITPSPQSSSSPASAWSSP